MKCINKLPGIFLIISLIMCLTGCKSDNYAMAYDRSSGISSFRVGSNDDGLFGVPFSENICVADEKNITEGFDVDASSSSSVGLFDMDNREVLYSKNIFEKLYPASLTKVMTALVALKYGNLNDIITVSSAAGGITESGAVKCGLKPGDTLTMDQALHALLINSANDAALAIAEHVGGSVEGFADMMNEEAMLIGATNSHFVNPHGLQDDNHFVTGYDMYLIFNEAVKYSHFVEIISMSSYNSTYSDKKGQPKTLSFESTNQYFRGAAKAPDNIKVIGAKTGTTNAAGNCLILYSRNTSGNAYISVILRCEERTQIYDQMNSLLSGV